MRYLYTRLTIILLAFLVASIAGADIASNISNSDPLLKQKIDYECWGVPLHTVIEELAVKTKVNLYCGSSNSDFKVRDQRANIRIKDLTLDKLMASLARTFKMKWQITKEEDKSPNYRLIADEKLWKKASKESEQRELDYYQSRKQVVDSYLNLADLNSTQLEALKQTSPLLYAASMTGLSDDVKAFINSVPGLYDAVIYNKPFKISSRNLNSNSRQTIINLNEAVINFQLF